MKMLIECPKCGFSQPKDQYCASCGVDMDQFRARPQPLKSRVLANPYVHITLMFVLVFAGTFYIIRQRQQQERQEISRRMEYLRGGPIYAETTDPSTGQVNSRSAETLPPPPPPPAAANSAPIANVNAPAGGNPTAGPQATAVASGTREGMRIDAGDQQVVKAKQPRAKVTYTLVSQNLLQQMPIEPVEAFGDFKVGILKNPAAFISKTDELESTDVKFENENSENMWLAGERPGDSFLGLQNRVALHGQEDGHLRGEIEILRMLPDEGSQNVTPQVYGPLPFVVQPGSALVVSINLPRGQLPARSLASTSSKFFRMYRTTDFLNKRSQFVMFIVFE